MRTGYILIELSLAGTSGLAAQTPDTFPPTPPVYPLPARPEDSLAKLRKPVHEKPPKLRKVGTWCFPMGNPNGTARVSMEAAVDTLGRIEPASVKVDSTTDAMFIPSARLTLMSATFTPGKVNGRPVKVLIWVPLVFDGTVKPRCVGNWVTTMLSPKCE